MSTLTLDESHANFQINSFKPGFLRINHTLYTRSVIISPLQLIEDWDVQTASELTQAALEPILNLKPDVLLIGTGREHIFLNPAIYGKIINSGIGVEVMDTAAACRTFNALGAENRNVVAALIIK